MSHAQQTPTYRKHKASGQAVVTLNGKMFYLGTYGSQASRKEYDRRIGEWLANGRGLGSVEGLTISELIARYWKHAQTYYLSASGHGGEIGSIKLVLSHLRRLYGPTDVRSFGPLALKSVRESMVSAGWSRLYINAQANRLRRVFKWGVENELVPADVWHALQAVSGLRQGKTEARECDPVKPVGVEIVIATAAHVSREVKAMIDLQLLTGMRPGEIVILRGCDIDTTGPLWIYTPHFHKTEHHGHTRKIAIGPKAKAVIEPFLTTNVEAYLFSPANAEADRRARMSDARKTPLNYGNAPGSNKARKPKRPAGDRYGVDTYRRAIERGCDDAFPVPAHLARLKVVGKRGKTGMRWETKAEWRNRLGPKGWIELESHRAAHHWHPHQLRHTAATKLRKEYGLEAAQVILGHQTLSVTQIYAEKNVEAARKIMAEVG